MFERLILENPEYGSEYAEPEPQKNILCVVNVVDSSGLGMAVILKDRIERETFGFTSVRIVDIRDPFPITDFDSYLWFNIDHVAALQKYYSNSISAGLAKEISKKSEKIWFNGSSIYGPEDLTKFIQGNGYSEALVEFHSDDKTADVEFTAAYYYFLRQAQDWYYGIGSFEKAAYTNFFSSRYVEKYCKDTEWMKKAMGRIMSVKIGNTKVAVLSFMANNIQITLRFLKNRGWNYIHRSSGVYGPVATTNFQTQDSVQEFVIVNY